jgi:hypothetical protein
MTMLNIVKRPVTFTIDDYDSNEKKQVSTRPDFEDLGTPRAYKLCNVLEQHGIGAYPMLRETLVSNHPHSSVAVPLQPTSLVP